MTAPRISAVIPVHDGEMFLYETLESVAWQTVEPIEVIVVDDGSSDCSAAIARAFPGVRCIAQEHLGVSAARNAGVAAATGDHVAFLDADDIWLPDKLARQSELLPAAMVISVQRTILSGGLTEVPPWYRDESVGAPVICNEPSSWLIPVSTMDAVGLFDCSYTHGEDMEWLSRARHLGLDAVLCDEVLLIRRIHTRNLSHNLVDSRRAVLRILRKSAAVNRVSTTTAASESTGLSHG